MRIDDDIDDISDIDDDIDDLDADINNIDDIDDNIHVTLDPPSQLIQPIRYLPT